jgi:hypothetical protein
MEFESSEYLNLPAFLFLKGQKKLRNSVRGFSLIVRTNVCFLIIDAKKLRFPTEQLKLDRLNAEQILCDRIILQKKKF